MIVTQQYYSIDDIQTGVERKYPSVKHIDPLQFLDLRKPTTIIFDVREKREYAISHLQDAIHVTPDISSNVFLKLYGEKVTGKHAIFYCSVGRRSSALINRLNAHIENFKPSSMLNLRGGIFQWHNKNRPIYNREKPTEFIHPYNWFWSRLIDNKHKIKATLDTEN